MTIPCVCVPFQFIGMTVNTYPAVFHSFPLSVFASLIAPFGGFFASGFKRAFNVKVCWWVWHAEREMMGVAC